MRTAEEQRRYLQEIVSGKIYWGEPDEHVLRWLAIERGVQGEEAEALIREAHRERRIAVRKRAILGLAWSIPGFFLGLGIIALFNGWRGWTLFGVSGIWIIKSTWQLMSGQVTGSVGDTE